MKLMNIYIYMSILKGNPTNILIKTIVVIIIYNTFNYLAIAWLLIEATYIIFSSICFVLRFGKA